MEKGPKDPSEEEYDEIMRQYSHQKDISNTIENPSLTKAGGHFANMASTYATQVEQYLTEADREGVSIEEVRDLMRKLEFAIVINNDQEARVLKSYLIKRFGDDAMS